MLQKKILKITLEVTNMSCNNYKIWLNTVKSTEHFHKINLLQSGLILNINKE